MVSMKIRLAELNERKLPDPDDSFARDAGPFATLEEMRRHIRDNFIKSRAEIHKTAARRKLLDTLLEEADFPVPEAMLESNLSLAVAGMLRDLERFGQSLDGFVPNPEKDLREEARPEALRRTREQVLLLAVARAHDLSVSDGELDLHLHRMALQDERDYAGALESYRKNRAFLQVVRERLLEDKALDFVYDKAVITMLPPDDAARRDIPLFAATEEGKAARSAAASLEDALAEAAPSSEEAVPPGETAASAKEKALSPAEPSPAVETG
jgi:trigger factor